MLLALALVSGLKAQPWVPGTSHFGPGTETWIEYRVGDMPLILSAPHDGTTTPSSIPDRTGDVTTVRDTNTLPLTLAIANEIFLRSGKRPHLVLCHLRRTKLDANREIVEAAQGHPLAEAAWHFYHGHLTIARQEVARLHGRGYLIDVHAHGHTIRRLELGYALSGTSLRLPDSTLNRPYYLTQSSINTLAAGSPLTLSQLLRGPHAFGTLIMNQGIPAVPAMQDPAPGVGEDYFNGGYISRTHTSYSDSGPIDGFQMETHSQGVRDNATNRAAFGVKMADVLHDYFRIHYGMDLGLRPQVRMEWLEDRVAEGGVARLRIYRAGDKRAPLVVSLVFSGTATPGVDYTSPPAQVTLPAQASHVDVTLNLFTDGLNEGTETVVASLLMPSGTEVVGAASATLLVVDTNTVQAWVEPVEALVPAGGEARFRIRRTASSGSLTLGLAAGGTARPGWDYAEAWPPATVTFAPGQSELELTVAVPAESRRRPDRTLSLTLGGGPGHRVGVPGTAMVLIQSAPAGAAGPILHLGGAQGTDRAADLANPGRRIGLIPDGISGPQAGGTTRRPHWSFDGESTAMFAPPFAAAPEGAFTIAFRFRTATFSGNSVRGILGWGTVDTPESVHVYMLDSDRQLRTVLRDGNDSSSLSALDAGTGFANNTWHHYALVVSPGQPARVYVNGVQRASSNRGGDPMPTPQHLWIGWREGTSTNRHWPGQLADLRWYHRALAVAEVQELAADSPGKNLWAQERGLNAATLATSRDSLGQSLAALYALGGEPDQLAMLPKVQVRANGDRVFRWAERADVPGLQIVAERLGSAGFGALPGGYELAEEVVETLDETWRERTLVVPPGTPTEILRLRVQGL